MISMPFPPAVAPWTPRARFDPAGNDIAQARYQNRKLALLTPAGSGSVQWKVQFSRRFKRVQRLQRIFRIYPPSSPRWGPAQKQQLTGTYHPSLFPKPLNLSAYHPDSDDIPGGSTCAGG